MKKYIKIVFSLLLVLCLSSAVFAQQGEAKEGQKVEFPSIYVRVDEGLTAGKVTRIVKQDDRSNYEWEDILAGAYCIVKTEGFEKANPFIRAAVYYPLLEKSEGIKQKTQHINLGFDGILGLSFEFSFWDYLYMNLMPGFHIFYEYTDRFNYIDLGAALMLQFEMPVSYEWTIVVNGILSYDYGNAGSNKRIEPYDVVWQEGIDLGVRYSPKSPNYYNYMHQTAAQVQARKDAKAEKREARKAKMKAGLSKSETEKPAKEEKAPKAKAEKSAKN